MVIKLKTFEKMMNGLHWLYYNDRGDNVSIICHEGSYGFKEGKFETMCSWKRDVQGYLTFKQVAQKLKTLEKRDIKINEG